VAWSCGRFPEVVPCLSTVSSPPPNREHAGRVEAVLSMTPRSTLLVLVSLYTLMTATLVAALDASAQPRDIVDRFPTPREVTADFGDDPSRRMALLVLHRALRELTPAPRSKAASDRLTDYFRIVNQMDLRYDRLGSSSSVRSAYYRRVGRLRSDGAFARAVLDKYRLTALFAERRGGLRLGMGIRGPTVATAIASGFPWAAPFWLGALVAIGLVPLVFARLLDGCGAARTSPDDERDPFHLPPRLRTMNVFGRRLNLDVKGDRRAGDRGHCVGVRSSSRRNRAQAACRAR
jgi:hypothetical protein